MADITRHGEVLSVTGLDVVNDQGRLIRSVLKAALASDANPVGNLAGKVDFVICFVLGGSQPGDFSGIDHTWSPRPLRGIIHLPDGLDNVDLNRLAGTLGGSIAHEIGHYWLVPGRGQIRTGSGLVDTPTNRQIWEALNQGDDYPPYPIIGRQDCHWSPFIDGENTPMEAGNLGEPRKTRGMGIAGQFGKYDLVEGQNKTGPEFVFPGEGLVPTNYRFSTFERWLMGSYKPPRLTTVGILWPPFLVFVPRWSYPFGFQAGLFVELQSGERWYLGFHEGPHQLCAQEVSSAGPQETIELWDPVLPDPYIRAGARVVRSGSTTHLQIRLWRPAQGCNPVFWIWRQSADPSCEEMMADLEQGVGSSPDPWSGWTTLAELPDNVARVGLSTRHTSGGAHVLLRAGLCIRQEGQTSPVSVFDLHQDIPAPGPSLLASGQLMLPYQFQPGTAALYREDATSHDAPKLTWNPPTGDFAFGGLIDLDRCVQVPWAGGFKPGKRMVGRAERVKFNRFAPLWSVEDKAIRQAEPLGGAYKFLFCAVARQADAITDQRITNLDRIRRAWEISSPLGMDRLSDTTIGD